MRQDKLEEWKRHRMDWANCERCHLHHTATLHVLASGTLPAEVVFLGEGPGKSEDLIGSPFVGPAGTRPGGFRHLLRDAFDRFRTFDYLVSNVVACRPNDYYVYEEVQNNGGTQRVIQDFVPNDKDRAPTDLEAAACHTRVVDLLRLANPKLVVLMGRTAQKFVNLDNIARHLKRPPFASVFIYHPSHILRAGGPNSSDYKRSILTLTQSLKQTLESFREVD